MSVGLDPRIGTELAGYRIERLLGRGGMSVVYLAEDLRLKRKVALKLLAPELAEDARFRERFLRESELAASLDHSNVIPIYEAGEAEGLLYIAMRYVEGTDLKTLLAGKGSLEPRRALEIVGQAATALDAAHARGLVHRDVKPGNILLTEESGAEHVYLADFGLTKAASSESGLTETGQFVGTADYVAPEQMDNRRLDGRTDLYSLGCVLFECLVGEPPYKSDRLMATLWAHGHAPPPKVSERNPELPAGLDPIVARALAKEPAERYATCRELVADAWAELGLSGELPQPAAAPRRRRLLLVFLTVVLTALAAAVLAVLLTGGSSGNPRPKGTTVITADSLQRIDAKTGELLATIAVGSHPVDVAVGEGSVWVVNENDQTLMQIDPEANALAKTVKLGIVPVAVAVGEGAVWMTQSAYGLPSQALWKYDLRSSSASAVATEGIIPFDVAVDFGSVWIADYGRVLRVSPETGATVASIPVDFGAFAVGEGSVWLGPLYTTGLLRIDPGTNEVEVAVGRVPEAIFTRMAVGEGAVWALDPFEDRVWRFEPGAGGITDSFRTGRLPKGMAVGEGAVWVANSRDGTVTRYDPKTADVETIEVGGTPTAVAVGAAAFGSRRTRDEDRRPRPSDWFGVGRLPD